jgi:O-antigen/teichoic acid export membrane protein
MIPKKSVGIFVDKILRLPLSYLVLICISNVYSVNDVGAFSLATAISSIIFVIADLGVTQYLVEISSTQDKEKFTYIASAFLIRVTANSLLLISLIALLIIAKDKLVIAILTLLALSNLIMSYPLCIRQILLDKHDYKSISVSDNFSSWSQQVFKLLFAGLSWNITFQAVSQIAASAIQSLFLFKGMVIITAGFQTVNMNVVRATIANSRHYLLSSVVVFAYVKADQLILSYFHGLASLASYSIAVMIIESSMILFPVLISLFSLKIADKSSNIASKSLRSLNRLLCLTAALFFCAAMFFATFGTPLLFGSKYTGLNTNIILLSPCIIITAITSSLILQMQHEQMSRIILNANTATAVASIALSIPMIYFGSAIGASIATCISSATLPVALLLFGGTKTKHRLHRLAI